MGMSEPHGEVGVAVIGAGTIGSFHAESLAHRVPGARLVAIVDPEPGVADRMADRLGVPAAATDPGEVLADGDVAAVVIATPARFHADLVVVAAGAGKHVFCEKPMGLEVGDARRAIEAANAAGVTLQVGFQRRFAADWREARRLLDDGRLGTPRLLRSLTRDPGFEPSRVPPNTIFLETLIHDFDVLRYLNPGVEPVEVYAVADALVAPEWGDRGLLDTAVVMVRFANGATGIAEACFEAAYGYDVRAEVFGSAGMATMGDGRRSGMVRSDAGGRSIETVRSFIEMFGEAYTAELAAFIDVVRTEGSPFVSGVDAAAALAVARAAIESAERGAPVRVAGIG
jgi:myo-inositol 2-dehydrogenase/D-chiro-inositol 1-dehydrogenase